ncbi:MAG: Vi polysaccharide biosynthesis UDP-N-acetylglucosamine C-6 dehydrogenase TviB [Erythrobacter sp.]
MISDVVTSKVAIVGLGYVGLPLAVEFGKVRPVVGFDISSKRIADLRSGVDHTREVEPEDLRKAVHLNCTDRADDLSECGVFILTVPTPVDADRRPDMRAMRAASETVARVMRPNALVIYESTVYPGATEEVCVPILEAISGMKFNRDFFVGYSPERINPGDRSHRLTNIVKVTSGSTPEAAEAVDKLYASIVKAGTHKASSIRVAEAAKVIENTQRDLNIAFINELSIIFDKLDIDTEEVLKAAQTKWNFLPFKPGLVGGHCIGVDPYYLTYKAEAVGYHPEIILAGRRLNDRMGSYVSHQLLREMARRGMNFGHARILIMGLTFKENCPDIRNTKVVDVVRELKMLSMDVDVYDPWVKPEEAWAEYGVELVARPEAGAYDGIILAVAHDDFRELGAPAIRSLGKQQHLLFDLKHILPKESSDLRL